MQPSSGCTGCISVPAQGDGESNRDGRKYCIKSIWVSGAIDSTALEDQANATEMQGWFFALVLDTQANGATIVSEQVYTNPGDNALNMLPQPLRNLQNSKRYRVLDSKYIDPKAAFMGTDGTNTNTINLQVAPTVSLSWRGNIICDSTGTTADVASASDNAIHLLAWRTGNPQGTFRGKSRMRFVG